MGSNPDNIIIYFFSENFLSSTSQTSSKQIRPIALLELELGLYVPRDRQSRGSECGKVANRNGENRNGE